MTVTAGVFIPPNYNAPWPPPNNNLLLDGALTAIANELQGYTTNTNPPVTNLSWGWLPGIIHTFNNAKGYATSGGAPAIGTPLFTGGVRYVMFDDTPAQPLTQNAVNGNKYANGTIGVICFAQPHFFYVGQFVQIAGVDALLNGNVQVTAINSAIGTGITTAFNITFATSATVGTASSTGTVASAAQYWNGSAMVAFTNIVDTTSPPLNTTNLGMRRFIDDVNAFYRSVSGTVPIMMFTLRTGAVIGSHNMERSASWQQTGSSPGPGTDEWDPQYIVAGHHDPYFKAFAAQIGDYIAASAGQLIQMRMPQEMNGASYSWCYNNQFVEPVNSILPSATSGNGPILLNALNPNATSGNPIASSGGSSGVGGYGYSAAMFRHIITLMKNSITNQLINAHNRTVTDGSYNGTTTITSATAKFNAFSDPGRLVSGNANIPANTTIVSVTNSTTVVLSHATTGGTLTGQTTTIGFDSTTAATRAANVQFTWCPGSGGVITPTKNAPIVNPPFPQVPHTYGSGNPLPIAFAVTSAVFTGTTATFTVTPGTDSTSTTWTLFGHGLPVGATVQFIGTGTPADTGTQVITGITNTTVTIASASPAHNYPSLSGTVALTFGSPAAETYVSAQAAWASYYPGDDVVDIVAFDGYNQGKTAGLWKNFFVSGGFGPPIFTSCYNALKNIVDPSKPFQISENGTVEAPPQPPPLPPLPTKSDWFVTNLYAGGQLLLDMPRVTQYVYFDAGGQFTGYQVRTSDASLATWQGLGFEAGWSNNGTLPLSPSPVTGVPPSIIVTRNNTAAIFATELSNAFAELALTSDSPHLLLMGDGVHALDPTLVPWVPILAAGSATTGQVLTATGAHAAHFAAISGQPVPVSSFTPGNPSGTVSLTQVMMGLGGVVHYTPVTNGKVIVTICGMVGTTVAITPVTLSGQYGTGSAPNNGDAVTGTAFPQGILTCRASSFGTPVDLPFTTIGNITGLSTGTAYWFDLAIATGNAADTAEVQSLVVTIQETS